MLATQAWLVLAGLATQSLLARVLAPEGRGAFAVCVMFGTILGVIFTPGADRGAQYVVIAGKQSLSRGVFVGLTLALVGTSLSIGVGILLIASPIEFFQKAEPTSFHLALALMPLSVILTVLQLQLAGLRRFAKLALLSALQSGWYVGAIVALVWAFDRGVDGALIALMSSYALSSWLMLYDLRRAGGLVFEPPTIMDFREVLDYGRKYHVARVGSVIDLQVGGLFLALLATPLEIGLFSAATGLILSVFIISESIESSLLPRIAAGLQGRPDLVSQCARLSALVSGAAVAALVVLSVPLVRILLSDAFLPTVPLLWILAPGVVLYASSKTLMAYFRGINRPGICSWVVWVGLCINVVGLVALYPLIGLPAAAWAMSIGFAGRSLMLAIAFKRVSGLSYFTTWSPRRADVVKLLAAGGELLGRLGLGQNRSTNG